MQLSYYPVLLYITRTPSYEVISFTPNHIGILTDFGLREYKNIRNLQEAIIGPYDIHLEKAIGTLNYIVI